MENVGSNRVPSTNSGQEKTRVSVAFTATASGHKLPAIILIPRKTPLKDFVPPRNVRIVYGTTGTFNSQIVQDEFIKGVLKPYRDARGYSE